MPFDINKYIVPKKKRKRSFLRFIKYKWLLFKRKHQKTTKKQIKTYPDDYLTNNEQNKEEEINLPIAFLFIIAFIGILANAFFADSTARIVFFVGVGGFLLLCLILLLSPLLLLLLGILLCLLPYIIFIWFVCACTSCPWWGAVIILLLFSLLRQQRRNQ